MNVNFLERENTKNNAPPFNESNITESSNIRLKISFLEDRCPKNTHGPVCNHSILPSVYVSALIICIILCYILTEL